VSTRLLLVEDHRIIREALRFSLGNYPDIEVVAEANNGREALKIINELLPDVVLMDLVMPEMNGIEATRRIVAEFPSTKVLIFSGHSDSHLIVEALKAGARGFIMKSCCALEELARAVRAIAADENYFSPQITGTILTNYMDLSEKIIPAGFSLISPREKEILQLIAEGKSAKEIAFVLDLSPKTVDTHRLHIMKKLKLCSVAELTKFAIREGLTTLD